MKVQYLVDEQNKFNPEGPSNEQLMKMFTTTKHTWKPL